MGINASAGWEQGLKKDAQNALGRAARSDGNARARMAANAGCTDDPGEPLLCPKCRTHYDTGLYCVDCDMELVGESFVDSVAPSKRPKDTGWIFAVIVTVGIVGIIVMMVSAIIGLG